MDDFTRFKCLQKEKFHHKDNFLQSEQGKNWFYRIKNSMAAESNLIGDIIIYCKKKKFAKFCVSLFILLTFIIEICVKSPLKNTKMKLV